MALSFFTISTCFIKTFCVHNPDKEDDYLMRNLQFLKLFPPCGDPVATGNCKLKKQQVHYHQKSTPGNSVSTITNFHVLDSFA